MSMVPQDVWLDRGSHGPGSKKGCVMEWVAVKWMVAHGATLSEAWARLTDSPRCTDPLIYQAAQRVNDRLGDDKRQRLVPLIERLARCHTPSDEVATRRVRVRVSCWAARSVLDLILDDEGRAVALRAIETSEAWLRGEATEQECAAAHSAASYDAASYASASAACVAAAAAAAAYASAASVAAAAVSVAAAAYDAERDLVAWLDELIDQWEKACASEGVLHEEVPVP